MKKLFTLAVVLFTALAASATSTAKITFTSGASVATWTSGPLTITPTNSANKMSIEANNCYFGDATAQVKFDARLKTGGKSASNNMLTLTVSNAGTLKLYARSGGKSEARSIYFVNGTDTIFQKALTDDDAVTNVTIEGETNPQSVYPVYSFSLAENTTYQVLFSASIYIYGFEYEYEGEAPAAKAANPSFSVAGGNYYDPFYLKLTSSDADHIYYSLNGAAYVEYTDSIYVSDYDNATKIAAYATKADALNSDTVKVEYTLTHFVARPVFNARETMVLGGVQSSQISIPSNNGTLGTYTMDGTTIPSVSYNHSTLGDGSDSTMTVKISTCPNLSILYKNGDNKSNVLKFANDYLQIDSKNGILYIDSVHGGDTIVIVATAKGSTAPHFDHNYSSACYLTPYQPEDDTDPCFTDGDIYTASSALVDNDFSGWTNLVYVVEEGHSRVRIKETAGGVRIAKIQVGAYRGEKTALDQVSATVAAQKFIENGKLVIVKNGVKYNAAGAIMK